MQRLILAPLCTAALALGTAAFAGGPTQVAEEPVVAAPVAVPAPARNGLAFTLRGGAAMGPAYFGSDDYEARPDLAFSLNALRLGGFALGSNDPAALREGFGLRGSLRYIGERSSDDHDELTGLEDVERALELGLGMSYAARNYELFADMRYGVVGHEALVGELGGNLIFHPSDRLTLSGGPRLQLGSSKFADTYFGVSAAESVASGGDLSAFDAGGGLLGAGIEVEANYALNDRWGIEAAATWTRLQNDAADSPITQDEDQYGVRIGLTRRVTFGF
ncbi:MipA/OmpV family protein [Cereibacter changlensis]|uniref:MipA/OmpV family protein n=1 Tax=Cereibacter changlensis TaxID=402884 RepID=A0A4U0YYC2_9RHOB|nr:MipA/OmpV family protein [Cereibacter changlensis]TKA97870.1 MipA/OmpV family protein [Cereibacter changlensis]